MQILSEPNLTRYGAYSPEKVYYRSDVANLIAHARMRGIAIVPEIDVPSHVREGWQWGPEAGLGELLLCHTDDCAAEPCGYLNITNPAVLKVLKNVYRELLDLFPSDVHHLGGDEVDFNCWNSSESVRQKIIAGHKTLQRDSFLRLWKDFLDQTSGLLAASLRSRTVPKAALWSSALTKQELSPLWKKTETYIIEVWASSIGKDVPKLLQQGFDVIVANSDAWYLDCGFGSWTNKGNNWCERYQDWATMYENRLYSSKKGKWTVTSTKERNQILGGEGCVWSETIDERSIDAKIWPRAAAIAERLWSDPSDYWKYANDRMQIHWERLVRRGVRADPLQPEWCIQHPNMCTSADNPKDGLADNPKDCQTEELDLTERHLKRATTSPESSSPGKPSDSASFCVLVAVAVQYYS